MSLDDVVHVGLDHLEPVTISCSRNMCCIRFCMFWDTSVAQIRQYKQYTVDIGVQACSSILGRWRTTTCDNHENVSSVATSKRYSPEPAGVSVPISRMESMKFFHLSLLMEPPWHFEWGQGN